MSSYWQLGGKRIGLERPRLMAIINATPDSFHAPSRAFGNPDVLRRQLEAAISGGADILDIGGQSTRPGSQPLEPAAEAERVLPVIELARELAPERPLTVDTYYAKVAAAALDAGADGVNDISAGRLDDGLLPLVAERRCGYVLMHMQGTPATMQQNPHYDDCPEEVAQFLNSNYKQLTGAGIAPERIVLDPGIGFGKRLRDNTALINRADWLAAQAARPLLYGISRKRFIASLSGAAESEERLAGTLGLTWELLNHGVLLHRLHDAAAGRRLLDTWQELKQS